MEKPDLASFMKQFKEHASDDRNMDERIRQAETLARLSELSSRGLLTELSDEWETLGKSAAHLLIRALVREPSNPVAVKALIVSAYRCDVMSRLFAFIRDTVDENIFECDADFRDAIEKATRKMLDELRE
jgi:hypothetical protein